MIAESIELLTLQFILNEIICNLFHETDTFQFQI